MDTADQVQAEGLLISNSDEKNTVPNPTADNTKPSGGVSVIAKGLNIFTFQGLAQSNGNFIVPTLDHQLLQISPEGTVSTLVQFCQGFECERFGAPFGIASSDDNLIVTVSGYSFGGSLVRVSRDGKFSTIADLTDVTQQGGPFGVAVSKGDFIVTTATDAMNSQGLLVRVSPNGTVKAIADLSEFGIPFAVTVKRPLAKVEITPLNPPLSRGETGSLPLSRGETGSLPLIRGGLGRGVEDLGQMSKDDSFIVATERGGIVGVSTDGKVSKIADLLAAGLGIPLGVTSSGDNLIVATNKGLLVRVNQEGTFSTIADLAQGEFGVASGVIESGNSLVVTTNAGYLLRVSL